LFQKLPEQCFQLSSDTWSHGHSLKSFNTQISTPFGMQLLSIIANPFLPSIPILSFCAKKKKKRKRKETSSYFGISKIYF
jgi:hypothetical protein